MLKWLPVNNYGQHWLTLNGQPIALVDERINGDGWRVGVNRQRSMGVHGCGISPTLAHAKKMAERWARANLPRLEREVAERIASRPRHMIGRRDAE